MKALESQRIILHCSATPPAMDVDVYDIREWHLARGWQDVGYHFVIKRDGTIQAGRGLDIAGAHTRGNNNSIGICYIGGVNVEHDPEDNMTAVQDVAFRDLVKWLRIMFGDLAVYGHNEFSSKACPSFDVVERFGALFCSRKLVES